MPHSGVVVHSIHQTEAVQSLTPTLFGLQLLVRVLLLWREQPGTGWLPILLNPTHFMFEVARVYELNSRGSGCNPARRAAR